jgi:3-oxoacyl-(acyl-carrier-protein) synthase
LTDNDDNRVVVTGIGALTPLGLDMDSTWESLICRLLKTPGLRLAP